MYIFENPLSHLTIVLTALLHFEKYGLRDYFLPNARILSQNF